MILALSPAPAIYAADDVGNAVHGTVEKVGSAGKTIVVKTADGTEHAFHYVGRTIVHGAGASADAAKDSWHGLTNGTEKGTKVVVYSTEDAGKKVAHFFEKV